MAWSESEATAHVTTLARRLRVKVNYRTRGHEAHLTTRQVWVPRTTGAVEYLTALHELGHLASATARRRGNQDYPALGVEVLVEGAAWAWASAVALPGLLAGMSTKEWSSVFAMLGSYVKYACYEDVPETMPQL